MSEINKLKNIGNNNATYITIYDIQRTVTSIILAILKKDLKQDITDNNINNNIGINIDEQITFVQLGADELDLFEFVLKLEDAFMIEISDADAEKLTSVAQTVSYIAARVLA